MTKSKIQKQQNLGSLCYYDIMLLYVIPYYVYVDLSYVAMYMLYYVMLCYGLHAVLCHFVTREILQIKIFAKFHLGYVFLARSHKSLTLFHTTRSHYRKQDVFMAIGKYLRSHSIVQ